MLPEIKAPLREGALTEEKGETVQSGSGLKGNLIGAAGPPTTEAQKGINYEGTDKSQDAGPKETPPTVAGLSENSSTPDAEEQEKKPEDVRARIFEERDERDKDLDPKREAELKDEWVKMIDKDFSVPGKPMKSPIPSRSGDPWGDWHRRLETFDNGFCGLSKDEIDKMLIFAGLFSAALTAFVAVSFTWLDDPMDDVKIQASIHVSNQLANSTGTAPFIPKPFSPSASVIRINIFWFLSLVLSLGAVLIGIICLQWIREYQRDVTHTSYQKAIAIRQLRFEGYQKWHVSRFVNTIPLLLHLSVILFFAGVFDLLLDRKPFIAYIVLVPMVIVVGILLLTTILPTSQLLYHTISPPTFDERGLPPAQCPYKSPQSWLFQRLVLTISGWLFSKKNGRSEHSDGVQPSTDLETGPITESQSSASDPVLTNVPTWRRWLPPLTGVFDSLKRTHNNTEPRDSANRDNIERMRGSLVKLAKADSWSALDEILHHENARAGSADKYFCEAWFWSRENACQSKEAYFDLLSCYSESDSGSLVHILTEEPDLDLDGMSATERDHLHWIKPCSTAKLYEEMIAVSNKDDPVFALLKGVPKEIALFCYLSNKKTPDFIRTQLYGTTYEIFERLRNHSHGKYTAKIEPPSLVNISVLGTRKTQQLQALYHQIAVIASTRTYFFLTTFDLPDSITSISDEQCQHCFREFGKYCLREGTVNGCTEAYRIRVILRSVGFLFEPGSIRQSTSTRRLGDALWEVSLDVVQYASTMQQPDDLLSKLLEQAKKYMVSTLRSGLVDFRLLKKGTIKRIDKIFPWSEFSGVTIQ